MIDPNLDHDDKTEPGGGWPVLTNEELDALAEQIQVAIRGTARAAALGVLAQVTVPVQGRMLAELLRLYRAGLSAGVALVTLGELGQQLQIQVKAAELAADGILRRAGARFEILLLWSNKLEARMRTGWHMEEDFRWCGTFDEARQIVRDKYGPKRGTEALIVVRVDE